MDDSSLAWEVPSLLLLLVLSGFFSIAETSMMALNRYRLRPTCCGGPISCSAPSSSATTW